MNVQAKIELIFGSTEAPVQFVNAEHCCECAEHNETLASHTPASISLTELGNPGWDPICFVSSIDAFKYYLPALTRLACGVGDEYYLSQFLFHLNQDRQGQLSALQRDTLAEFLESLVQLMPDEIERNLDAGALLSRIDELRRQA